MSEIIKEFKKGDLLYIGGDEKAYWGVPEGYPYKEEKAFEDIIWDGNTEGRTFIQSDGVVLCKVGKPIKMDKIIGAKSVFHNTLQNHDLEVEIKENAVVRISDETYMENDASFICAFRSVSIEGIEINEPGMYFAKGSGGYVSGLYAPETTHPIFPELLPLATPTTAGIMKQAAAVANVTAAPTAEEFNALLKSLRDAGILATK